MHLDAPLVIFVITFIIFAVAGWGPLAMASHLIYCMVYGNKKIKSDRELKTFLLIISIILILGGVLGSVMFGPMFFDATSDMVQYLSPILQYNALNSDELILMF